jgi:hypothetical protein
MSQTIDQLTAPDNYSKQSTIVGPIDHVIIDVANQTIYWQRQVPAPGQNTGVWEDNAETPMTPGSRAIYEPMTGFRFRAKFPLASLPAGTNQAVVTVRAVW